MPFGGLLTVGLIGAGTSLFGGIMGSNAAGNAADAQSQAAMYAADQQKAAADQALAFQKQQYGIGQNEMAPWLSSGTGALANLSNLLGLNVSGNATLPGAGPAPRGGPVMGGTVGARPGMGGMNIGGTFRGGGGGSLMSDRFHSPMMGGGGSMLRNGGTMQMPGSQPASPGGLQTHQVPMQSLINPALGAKGSLLTPFQAPTDVTMQNDPGYKFRLQEGQNAIERSAAAKGGVLTGGTAKALDAFGQDYGSNEYQNVYNRAHDTYQTNYLNKLNPLMAMAGLGQQTGGQLLSAGNNSANSISDILMSLGNSQAQGINNAGAARGSGYLNSAGAWGGAANGIGNSLEQMMLLRRLFPGGSGGGGYPDFTGGGGGNYNPVTGGY